MNGQAQSPNPMTRITIQQGKRAGQPCIREYRITVNDILEDLAGGMTPEEVLREFPELEYEDLLAVYAYAAKEVKGSSEV